MSSPSSNHAYTVLRIRGNLYMFHGGSDMYNCLLDAWYDEVLSWKDCKPCALGILDIGGVMGKATVVEVLRRVEWRAGSLLAGWHCPWCVGLMTNGHRDDCKLAALLSKAVTHADKEEKRIVAIMGGGDWYDASVEHLVVPGDMDLDAEHQAHKDWYYQQYCAALQAGNKIPYLGFSEWLIKQGARQTTDDEVLEFWEGP